MIGAYFGRVTLLDNGVPGGGKNLRRPSTFGRLMSPFDFPHLRSAPGSHVRIKSARVQPIQARVFLDTDGTVYIERLHVLGQIKVNDRSIPPMLNSRVALADEDHLTIGATVFHWTKFNPPTLEPPSTLTLTKLTSPHVNSLSSALSSSEGKNLLKNDTPVLDNPQLSPSIGSVGSTLASNVSLTSTSHATRPTEPAHITGKMGGDSADSGQVSQDSDESSDVAELPTFNDHVKVPEDVTPSDQDPLGYSSVVRCLRVIFLLMTVVPKC